MKHPLKNISFIYCNEKLNSQHVMINFLVIFLSLVSFSSLAQPNELFDVEWNLKSSVNLPKMLYPGDTLIFLKEDDTPRNPKVTLYVESNGKVIFSLTSFSQPNENGIAVDEAKTNTEIDFSEDDVPPYKIVHEVPMIVSECQLNMKDLAETFQCGIIVGFKPGDYLYGPFDYTIVGNQLTLVKKH